MVIDTLIDEMKLKRKVLLQHKSLEPKTGYKGKVKYQWDVVLKLYQIYGTMRGATKLILYNCQDAFCDNC